MLSYRNSYFNPNHYVFLNPSKKFQWLKLTELPAYSKCRLSLIFFNGRIIFWDSMAINRFSRLHTRMCGSIQRHKTRLVLPQIYPNRLESAALTQQNTLDD